CPAPVPPCRRSLPPPLLSLLFLPDPPTTQLSTLSLHDALPISIGTRRCAAGSAARPFSVSPNRTARPRPSCCRFARSLIAPPSRSEEHTSELQSLTNLVCRLLLEKKKDRPELPPVVTHCAFSAP